MSAAKKVTVTLPDDILASAQRITGKGITSTIIDGLLALERGEKRTLLRSLRGKLDFELDSKTRR